MFKGFLLYINMPQNNMYYDEKNKIITKIQFSIYGNDIVRKHSVVADEPYGIDLAESYDNYEPKKGGLVDLRLGTCDMFLSCTTCGEQYLNCPGHFGHTTLAEPVFHHGFLQHLKNILSCICLKCSKILVDKVNIYYKKLANKTPEIRFKEIKNATKTASTCYNCGWVVHKLKKEERDNGSIKIVVERSTTDEHSNIVMQKKIKEFLTPKDCYAILRNITDEECLLLGFDASMQRPEDMIIKYFPIPPVIIRPTAKIDFLSAATMEDGLTLKIADIINSNKRIRQQKEKDTITTEVSIYNQDIFNLLQYHVTNYYNNENSLPKSEFKTGGVVPKSICERIQGKHGRIRSNLMGKRVDFSARTVITPDPYIDINQVGVPLRIAMELTIPVEVTPYNIKYLSQLVKNGKDKYPGANYILKVFYKDDNNYLQKIDLKHRKKSTELAIGDIVERHIINDDYVLFNRQPTLHKPSMMGHRVFIIPNNKLNTFRMNVSVCAPYNADFDGDEMNIHLPQSIQTHNEIEYISNVKYQIVSAKNSIPIIYPIQDTITGVFLMSKSDIILDGKNIANILCTASSARKYELDINKKYTGIEVFSYIIPKEINITKKINDKIILEIKNGNILNGRLNKSAIISTKESLIDTIWNKLGSEITKQFIDDSQRIVLNFLLIKGLTTGFHDCIYDIKLYNQIQHIISTEILKSKYNITQYENDIISVPLDVIENNLTQDLQTVLSQIGQICLDNFDEKNFMYTSIKSGSKGSIINLSQMIGVKGQVILDNKRFMKKIENRTLFYFHKDDDTPEARGFVKNSYLSGLRLYEAYYDASTGREGMIGTSISTAISGYITRRFKKSMEDIIIRYDGTARNDKHMLIQLVYGDNGIDQAKQSQLYISVISMNNKDIEEKLCFSSTQIKELSKTLNIKESILTDFNKEYLNKMKYYRDTIRKLYARVTLNYKILENQYMLPINLFRITQDYTASKNTIDLSPLDIVAAIENFLNDYSNRIIVLYSKKHSILKNDDRQIKFILEMALYDYLAPMKCLYVYNLNKNTFQQLMDDIRLIFIKALAEPGEAVGIIASNCLGESTTQMTLNTKHNAGVVKGISGMDRTNELMHVTKNIKVPQMILYFKKSYTADNSKVNNIVSNFKFLSLRELTNTIEIFYDMQSSNEYDTLLNNDNVSNPFFINNQKTDLTTLPIIFRFKMNTEIMMNKEITLLDIKTKFISYWYTYYNNIKLLKKHEKDIISKISRCAILSNNITDSDQIIHIRFNMISFNYDIINNFLNMILDDIKLKGIHNILNIEVVSERNIDFDESSGDIIETKEFVAYTDGINMEAIKTIKGIDHTRTRCNNIYTILNMYGIEAARQILLYEFMLIYQSSGSNINFAHYTVLVDQMTYLGEILSIDRNSIAKVNMDPLSKASFEKTMNNFVNSAIFNEIDYVNSVSSRIIMGRVIPNGTGAFDLILDAKKILNSEYMSTESSWCITYTPLEKEPLIMDIIKSPMVSIQSFIPV